MRTKHTLVLATALVVTVITFITIVFGELVPKRIGQLYPEAAARWVSRPMAAVARGAKPFVWLLTHTTQWVLKALRVDNSAAQVVTEEEIQASLAEGVDAGIIEAQEHRMVRNVFGLDERLLTSIMVRASDIEWLDAAIGVPGGAHASLPLAVNIANTSGWMPFFDDNRSNIVAPSVAMSGVPVASASRSVGTPAISSTVPVRSRPTRS